MNTIAVCIILFVSLCLFIAGFVTYLQDCIVPSICFITIGVLCFICGVALTCIPLKPAEKDVLEGNAIYQETLHITNNDTIKTYQIVWKDKDHE